MNILSKELIECVIQTVGIQVVAYREFLKHFDGDEKAALIQTGIFVEAMLRSGKERAEDGEKANIPPNQGGQFSS